MIFVWVFFAGGIALRLVALTFGTVVPAESIQASTEKNLKGYKRQSLNVTYVTSNGTRRSGTFPIGLGMRHPLLNQPLLTHPKVAYLEAAPFVAGLVDDFGYSVKMATLLFTVSAGVSALLAGVHGYETRLRNPTIIRLHEYGVGLPITVGTSLLGRTRISYVFEGQTYHRRVPASHIWRAERYADGLAALVNPRRPRQFVLYGVYPYVIRAAREPERASRTT